MTVSSSPALSALIKGMFAERPPVRSLVPEWDLPLVLRYLAETFEPIEDLRLQDLTLKTVFLVAVACGRRCSDIHALSIDEHHLRFTNGGVSILPRTGFLAKNQTMSFTPSAVFLPDLVLVAGQAEKPSCPVRALRWYLKRTKEITGDTMQLFITLAPLATWLPRHPLHPPKTSRTDNESSVTVTGLCQVS